MVGALFPAVGDSIGKLDLPEGVAELLGGADYGTITGLDAQRDRRGLRAAGDRRHRDHRRRGLDRRRGGERHPRARARPPDRPLAPGRSPRPRRSRSACSSSPLGTWLGLVVGVAVGGGGIALGHLAALAVHLAFFGLATGALALALAAATGRRARRRRRRGGRSRSLGFLINGFAPLVDGLELAQVPLAVLLLRGPRPARQRRRHRRPRRARRGGGSADRGRGSWLPPPRPARLIAASYGSGSAP